MKTAKKKVLLCVSLITLSLALVLAPFTGAIEGDVTAGNTTDGVWDIIRDDILSADSLLASLGDSPTTWTVHPTDNNSNFRTIQSAIYDSKVANGDSIEVWNGTYKESVVLNKRLTLYSRDGANVTIVNAGGLGNAITIIADSCAVDGFMATGSKAFLGHAGIIVESNGNNIMNNLCCANGNHGIFLYKSSNNTILNNNCSENARGIGIYLVDSSNNIISYNEIKNSYYGLYIVGSSDNVVSNNEICNSKFEGLYVKSSSNNRIYCNDFVKNKPNVGWYSSNTTIWNSTRKYNYTYNGRKYRSYIGNYFSDYGGDENGQDGIGMAPYFISEKLPRGVTPEWRISMQDSYPLIQPFKNYILENVLPIADFTFSPLNPIVNKRVIFDASLSYDPDGAIILYQWDFGDSNITSMAESTITHYYHSTADYAVTLKVTDDSSAISSTSKVITIISKSPFLPHPPLTILPSPPQPVP